MESREKFGESIVQFKNGSENPESTKIERVEKKVVRKRRSWFGRLYRIARTLRVVELLIVVALLTVAIYIMAGNKKQLLGNAAGILLIALFVTYLIILSADTFSRITQRSVPDAPMFLFAVLGFLLFAAAAEEVYILRYRDHPRALLLAIIILCSIEALLFLLDVTLLILNWRQAYMRVDKCPFGGRVSNITTIYKPGDNYSQRTIRISDPLVYRGDVHDVTTSVSDYQRPSHPDLVNLHKYRKIGVGHRRQYVDRPVNAQSAVLLRVVDVQTDPPEKKAVSDVESLIVADVKEEPAQTTPKCPVCANNWDPHGSLLRRQDNFGLCPTFLHLAQGFGMCNCSQPSSSVLRPIPVELRTESTSATDLGVSKRVEKPNSRRNSSQERK